MTVVPLLSHQKGETKSVKGKIEQNCREGLDKRCAWPYLLVPAFEFPSSFLSPVNSCPWKCLTDLNQVVAIVDTKRSPGCGGSSVKSALRELK